jgi:tetratricopeptide (TPR) repeat protein
VRHLLSDCEECQNTTARAVPFLAEEDEDGVPVRLPVPEESAFDEATLRVCERAEALRERIQRERQARERLVAWVRSEQEKIPASCDSFESFLGRIQSRAVRMPTRARVEAFLTLSFEERARNPWRMLQLAWVANVAAINLPKAHDAADYSRGEIADLQARSWCELGNAYRRNDDFDKGDGAFDAAEEVWSEGSEDPLLRAQIYEFKAALRTDQRRYEAAEDLRDRAFDLYEEQGERHLAGRVLHSKGAGHFYAGETEEAETLFRKALAMLEPERDPQLVASSRLAMIDAMNANGRYSQAAALLMKSGLREVFASEPINRLKVRWVEARINFGLGKLDRAAKAFAEARASFIAEGLDYEAALIGLESAGILLQRGNHRRVESLAAEALDTFEELQIHPEASHAVRELKKAARARKTTGDLLRKVVFFLERLPVRPDLVFLHLS